MADIMDVLSGIGDIAKAAMPSLTGYLGQQMQIKQAKQIAKIQAGSMAGMGMRSAFPTIGMGYGATPLTPSMGFGGGAVVPYGGGGGLTLPNIAEMSRGNVMGDFLTNMGPGPWSGGYNFPGVTAGGSSTAPMARRTSLMMGPDGRMYRSVGRPLLWSGDLAAFKRVRKIARKLRSYAGHSRFH